MSRIIVFILIFLLVLSIAKKKIEENNSKDDENIYKEALNNGNKLKSDAKENHNSNHHDKEKIVCNSPCKFKDSVIITPMNETFQGKNLFLGSGSELYSSYYTGKQVNIF